MGNLRTARVSGSRRRREAAVTELPVSGQLEEGATPSAMKRPRRDSDRMELRLQLWRVHLSAEGPAPAVLAALALLLVFIGSLVLSGHVAPSP